MEQLISASGSWAAERSRFPGHTLLAFDVIKDSRGDDVTCRDVQKKGRLAKKNGTQGHGKSHNLHIYGLKLFMFFPCCFFGGSKGGEIC